MNDFFEDIASGKVKRGGAGDIIDHADADRDLQISESVQRAINSRTILNFSDFKK